MYLRHSLPLNHLTPSVLFSHENRTPQTDPARRVRSRKGSASECSLRPWDVDLAARARN